MRLICALFSTKSCKLEETFSFPTDKTVIKRSNYDEYWIKARLRQQNTDEATHRALLVQVIFRIWTIIILATFVWLNMKHKIHTMNNDLIFHTGVDHVHNINVWFRKRTLFFPFWRLHINNSWTFFFFLVCVWDFKRYDK